MLAGHHSSATVPHNFRWGGEMRGHTKVKNIMFVDPPALLQVFSTRPPSTVLPKQGPALCIYSRRLHPNNPHRAFRVVPHPALVRPTLGEITRVPNMCPELFRAEHLYGATSLGTHSRPH